MAIRDTNVRTEMMTEPPECPTPGISTRYGWYTENEVEGRPMLVNRIRKQHRAITFS